MEIRIKIREIDYGALAEACMPMMRSKLQNGDGMAAKLLAGLAALPPSMLRATLDALPQQTKDEAAAFLIGQNKQKIIESVTDIARQNGVGIVIDDLCVETGTKGEAV